jgi:hypothetical protein
MDNTIKNETPATTQNAVSVWGMWGNLNGLEKAAQDRAMMDRINGLEKAAQDESIERIALNLAALITMVGIDPPHDNSYLWQAGDRKLVHKVAHELTGYTIGVTKELTKANMPSEWVEMVIEKMSTVLKYLRKKSLGRRVPKNGTPAIKPSDDMVACLQASRDVLETSAEEGRLAGILIRLSTITDWLWLDIPYDLHLLTMISNKVGGQVVASVMLKSAEPVSKELLRVAQYLGGEEAVMRTMSKVEGCLKEKAANV